MPGAHRHALPGHLWHLTHCCHRRQFLLRFARDRRCWRSWLFQARKRYGLCVLDYQTIAVVRPTPLACPPHEGFRSGP